MSGWNFIISNINPQIETPIHIYEGHFFRAADNYEVEIIKKQLELNSSENSNRWPGYERTVLEEINNESTTYRYEELVREKWRYWVVSYPHSNDEMNQIENILLLLPYSLEFGLSMHYFDEHRKLEGSYAQGVMSSYIREKYTSHEENIKNPTSIAHEVLFGIGDVFLAYKNLDTKFDFIKIALTNYSQLRAIPERSDLIIVGLFSIIESLITHAPRLNESLDSINHQISNKIILLRKRYGRSVEPSCYFLHSAEENFWKKMYSYRSSVAHGTPVHFNGDLQILKSREKVIKFLRDNIKEIILLSLKEPDLIFDLRKC